MMRTDNSFHFWLDEIRKRPGLFLGQPSLTALFHFWNGYAFGRRLEMQEESKGSYCPKYRDDGKIAGTPCKPWGEHFIDGFEEFALSYYNCD